jgi:hypothetical protein
MDSHAEKVVAQSLDKVRGQAGKHLFWLRHPATVDLGALATVAVKAAP